MSKLSRIGHALYQGQISIDFVGRRRLWYAISGLILLLAVGGLVFKGLNYGIEFEGGVEYRVAVPASQRTQHEVNQIRDAVSSTGIPAASTPIVNTSGDFIRVQTEPLGNDQANRIADVIQKTADVPAKSISQSTVGPTWGAQIADRALMGLAVFTVLVILFIWAYFREWKMSVGAIVALIHDLVITVGVYALTGFEVTPATVTGVLTILGFSLYDTVVVFDKVRENTKMLHRTHQTYREAANLAINQTLVRSINTSLVALLPVGAMLYVGIVYLGSGALKDLALALFVGMAAGAYSSIFIATPLVVQLKELEPGVKAGDRRALKHRKRQEVDRFAHVPVFTEDMPVQDQPGQGGQPVSRPPARGAEEEEEWGEEPAREPVRTPRYTAGERSSSRPVSPSAAAKRSQPSRKPRSRRGKK
jgi:preprotein translocase subunit SecF